MILTIASCLHAGHCSSKDSCRNSGQASLHIRQCHPGFRFTWSSFPAPLQSKYWEHAASNAGSWMWAAPRCRQWLTGSEAGPKIKEEQTNPSQDHRMCQAFRTQIQSSQGCRPRVSKPRGSASPSTCGEKAACCKTSKPGWMLEFAGSIEWTPWGHKHPKKARSDILQMLSQGDAL